MQVKRTACALVRVDEPCTLCYVHDNYYHTVCMYDGVVLLVGL